MHRRPHCAGLPGGSVAGTPRRAAGHIGSRAKMDPARFDGLTRVLSQASSRRGVMAFLAALPLAGVLTTLSDDEAVAERPRNRLQRRTGQRNRKQRNRKSHKNHNQKQNGGGLGGSQCGATGSVCTQDSDCCTNNCFGFACAERVTSCGQGSTATRCQPPAKGCAGNQCCHGSLACGDTCCQGAANQCNPANACCVPNCAGRQCGDDGCGNGGTCGSCQPGQTCDAATGTCQGRVACSAQNCPNGCCDAEGNCQSNTREACGTGGAVCAPCSGQDTVCRDGVCEQLANTLGCLCNNGTRPSTCTTRACDADTYKAICPDLCAGAGGWAIMGQVAECNPHSCLP